MVDQTPIGRTTRSNPASYVGAFDVIRKRFAAEAVSLERGYTVGTFSFNSGNGRCPTCGGNGFEHVEMQFLADVYLRCPDCDGRRYRPEILDVKLVRGGAPDGVPRGEGGGAREERGLSIADVLDLTVSEAAAFFAGDAEVLACLEPLVAVGLEYLRLGQPVPTLSGGEAQRLKLAGHLVGAASGDTQAGTTLFLFDEPTTGLHFHDVTKLLGAFERLLAGGSSLLVIEHNLDVIRAADWILDLGPEGRRGRRAIDRRGHTGRCQGEARIAHRAGASRLRHRATPRIERRSSRARKLAGARFRRGRRRWPSPTPAARRSSCTAPASTTCRTSTSRSRATGLP
jgi:excinuclease ABC subunit A